jgi:nitrite reductase (NADH) small subunit
MPHVLGPASQIPPGEGRSFIVGGVSIAVFHTRGGNFFATQAYCPHRGGPLADGLIDEATVVCPLHDRIYALASGEGIGNTCALAVYPTKLLGEQLVVEVDPEKGKNVLF